MKKLFPLFALCFPLALFSQAPPPSDSLVKMATDFFKIKKLQEAILAQSPAADSTGFAESILLMGTDNYGERFPDFNAVSLTGASYSTESLAGKVTFINFWFENCPPCIAEFGALNDLYKRYKDNEAFLFLSFTWEKKENAHRVAQQYGLEYPILSISKDSCRRLINHIRGGYPTNLITDKDGKIQFYLNGGPTDPKEVRKLEQAVFIPLVEALLGKTR